MARGDYIAHTRIRSTDGAPLAHPELRKMLVEDAARQGISMNEAAVKILADRFRVPFEVTLRKTSPSTDHNILNLHLPAKLASAIDARAKRPVTMQDVIRATLCQHYGLKMPPKIKRTRQRRAGSALAA